MQYNPIMKQITGKHLIELIQSAHGVYMVDISSSVNAIAYGDDGHAWMLVMDATDIEGNYYEFSWKVLTDDLFDIDDQYIYLPDEENKDEPHKIQLLMPAY